MECNESQPLLNAYVDGELDLVRHLEVETHLKTCAACAKQVASLEAGKAAFRANIPRYTASPTLVSRLQSITTEKPVQAAIAPTKEKSRKATPFILFGTAGSALAAAIAVGFFLGLHVTRVAQLEQDVVAAHIRSLQVDHLTDVASTDQHTVKPWFVGKLDFSPPVLDLATEDFPLIGGRLDRIQGHAAAALVYKRRQHVINLFIWPASTGTVVEETKNQDGYHLISWTQNGFAFLVASDVSESDLNTFVKAYRSKI